MTQAKTKRPGYLESALNEVGHIIGQAKDKNDATEQIRTLLEKKVVESFKNGISVGMKKAGKMK